MSSWIPAEGLISEVTCPVCLGLYRDPVRLPCEHNLCRACLGECEPGYGERCEPGLVECEPGLVECEPDFGEHCEPGVGECEPGVGECVLDLEECEAGLGDFEPGLGEFESGLAESERGLGSKPGTGTRRSQAGNAVPSLRCPQCLETISMVQVKSNQLLANIVERVRRLRVDESPPGTVCPRHNETLKLYCTEDQQPICLVCSLSREHRDHSIIPIHEASQLCQEQLRESLTRYENRQAEIERLEKEHAERVPELKASADSLRDHISSEFQTLLTFLQGERDSLLERLGLEEARILREINEEQEKLQEERVSLSAAIGDIHHSLAHNQPLALLKNDKDLTTRVGAMMIENSERCLDWELCVGVFRGPLQYLAWKRMKQVISPALAAMTLDPSTANPYLALNEELTSARYTFSPHQRPDSRRRFDFCACVLGAESVSSGRHYWEVEVGGRTDWDIGVASADSDHLGWIVMTPENGFYTFGHVEETRVGVYVDHKAGQVSFYSAGSGRHLRTLSDHFTGPLFPFYYPSADSTAPPLTLCHH